MFRLSNIYTTNKTRALACPEIVPEKSRCAGGYITDTTVSEQIGV